MHAAGMHPPVASRQKQLALFQSGSCGVNGNLQLQLNTVIQHRPKDESTG
jgi:hypothetical protein